MCWRVDDWAGVLGGGRRIRWTGRASGRAVQGLGDRVWVGWDVGLVEYQYEGGRKGIAKCLVHLRMKLDCVAAARSARCMYSGSRHIAERWNQGRRTGGFDGRGVSLDGWNLPPPPRLAPDLLKTRTRAACHCTLSLSTSLTIRALHHSHFFSLAHQIHPLHALEE